PGRLHGRPGPGARVPRGIQLKSKPGEASASRFLRRALLPAIWVLGTLAATGVSWTAVQSVSGVVVENQPAPLSSGTVSEQLKHPAAPRPTEVPSPPPAYWVETGTEDGGATIEVRFRSDAHESRLDASCSGSTVVGTIEEQSS